MHPGRLGGVELVTAGAWHGRILAVSRDAPALSTWPIFIFCFLSPCVADFSVASVPGLTWRRHMAVHTFAMAYTRKINYQSNASNHNDRTKEEADIIARVVPKGAN